METATGTTSSESANPAPNQRDDAGWHAYWEKEMTAADKRLENWRKRGDQIVERYEGKVNGDANRAKDRGDGVSLLNLFNTGVSTKQAMLCGQTPQTDVSRQFADPDDDDARVAAVLMQRLLDNEDNAPSDKDLKSVLDKALQDRLLPGIGIARVRYAYGATKVPITSPITGATEEVEQISWEDAPIDYVHWRDFAWGWCRDWATLPWMGFGVWFDKDAATKRWGAEKADLLEYQKQSPQGKDGGTTSGDDQKSCVQKARVWEIWDRATKTVYFYSPGAGTILEKREDPLKLDNFWPAPKCLFANLTTTLLEPTPDFILAQDLYNEIDTMQTRISILVKAVKAVGTYDKSAGDSVGRMLTEAEENQLIPVDNWAMFQEKGGLKGVTDWFPVVDVVNVIDTLQKNRQQMIELLYEVTGMSDIMRGANTDQYTSDGTNKLKAKFGSIRVQALQNDFARFASELQGLRLEVISKLFTPMSIAQQANARYLPEADQPRTDTAIALIKSQDVKWRTKVKPESIAMLDYEQQKEERVEWVTAVATYIQSVQAAAKEMPQALPVFIEVLKWTMAGFKGSEYLEGIFDQAIQQMRDNPPGQSDQQGQAEAMKLQAEKLKLQGIQMKLQGEIQKVKIKSQADLMLVRMKNQGDMQKLLTDQQGDERLENLGAYNRLKELDRELATRLEEIAAELDADLQREEMQSAMAIAEEEVDHANTMTQLRYQAGMRAAEQDINANA